ncbi:MAG: cation:proton antiporter [Candidatus Cloacimonetes bacterium]|nr:cation:proton antiporter [Candidatus Cloacimonadota bacterium]
MQVDNNLLSLGLILILSALNRAISTKYKTPPVIGLLLLGVVLGPTFLNLVKYNEILHWIGEVGVLLLLFQAGLETDVKRIRHESKQAFPPALGGVLLPLITGFILVMFMTGDVAESLVVGVIMTATSVSVSVMTLYDLGKMKSIEGRCIVNAAIIDDVIGILLITVIFAIFSKDEISESSAYLPFVKIIGFFIITYLSGRYLIPGVFNNLKRLLLEQSVTTLAIAFIFIFAWLAEYAELAAITGSYFAGLFLGQTLQHHKINSNIEIIGKALFIDIFFVGIGLKFDLLDMTLNIWFLIGFNVLAIFSKLLGSGIGARLTGLDNIRAYRIGSGMIPRGEVALIVANMAMARNLISQEILSASIIMVIVTAIIPPIMLKHGFTKLQGKTLLD